MSLHKAFVAASGPELVIVMVYEIVVLTFPVAGPVLVMLRSALAGGLIVVRLDSAGEPRRQKTVRANKPTRYTFFM